MNRARYRFTDFLVFEVDLDGKTVHIKSLAMPASQAEKANPDQQTMMDAVDEDVSDTIKISHALPDGSTSVEGSTVAVQEEIHSERVGKDDEGPWPERFNASLKPFLSEDAILKLRGMFLEGPQLPTAVAQVSEGPQPETAEVISMDTDETITLVSQETPGLRQKTVSHKAGRGGRVGRGERDNNRGGRHKERREDTRRVLSEVRLVPILSIRIFAIAVSNATAQLAHLVQKHANSLTSSHS
jgi:tRNA pseudouridine13 synthase